MSNQSEAEKQVTGEWKLVPRNPTEEMLVAMDECAEEGYDERLYAGMAASVFMAAVDAAPNPSEAEQKPVAWLHTKIEGVAVPHRPADLDKHPDRWAALYKTPPSCQTCESLARTVMLDQTSHDAPPQRQFVGLTDEEYKNLHLQMGSMYFYQDYGKAIEAKLKEKNI